MNYISKITFVWQVPICDCNNDLSEYSKEKTT